MRALVTPKPIYKANFKERLGWLFNLLWFVPLALLWAWLSPVSWYEFWYDTDTEHVHMQAEPHDCDFLKAPLGYKECHYQRQVETEKDPKTGKTNVYIYWNKVEGN